MAIDVANETVVSLTEATKLVPKIDGKRPSLSTMWRWCVKGLGGVQLEHLWIGRRIVTSREALSRFYTARTEAQRQLETTSAPPPPTRRRPTPKARQRALDEADRILKEAGIA